MGGFPGKRSQAQVRCSQAAVHSASLCFTRKTRHPRVWVACILKLTDLAEPVEMPPRLRCNTQAAVCFVPRTVRVCVAFLLRVSVAVLLELAELAKPVEMPCLCCNTQAAVTDTACVLSPPLLWSCRGTPCGRGRSRGTDAWQQALGQGAPPRLHELRPLHPCGAPALVQCWDPSGYW